MCRPKRLKRSFKGFFEEIIQTKKDDEALSWVWDSAFKFTVLLPYQTALLYAVVHGLPTDSARCRI